MKGSIFRKLLTVYLAISLISLFGLSILISLLLESELRTSKKDELQKQAETIHQKISEMTTDQLLSNDLKLNLKEELRTLEREHNIRSTFIFNPKNTKKLTSIGLSNSASGWIKQIFAGNQLFFVGSIETNGQELLTLGTPVEKDGEVVLIFLLAMPSTDLQSLNSSLQQMIFIAFLITAFLISATIYFVSKRFIIPINRLNEAAANIADGHFHERVPVHGTDEISRLSVTFNEMASKLDAIEQHRTRFIGDVAHELRTPLTTILGTLRGMMDGTIQPVDQHEFLQNAFDEVQRLGRLVNDLLELVRFEEKAVPLTNESFHLSSFIHETIVAYQNSLPSDRVTLQMQLQPEIHFSGDMDRFRQVLVNLISNAITHNPGPITITVSLERLDHQIMISVHDNGKGIAQEHLPLLFERFYKADHSRSTRGSGLGLAICRSIVEQSGGKIEVLSGSNGTTFRLIFDRK